MSRGHELVAHACGTRQVARIAERREKQIDRDGDQQVDLDGEHNAEAQVAVVVHADHGDETGPHGCVVDRVACDEQEPNEQTGHRVFEAFY